MKNNIKTQLVGILGVGAFASMAVAGGGGYYSGGGSAMVSGATGAAGSAMGAVGNTMGAVGNLAGGIGGMGRGILGDITGTVSGGYDTDYFFRGVQLGDDPVWGGIDLSIPLGEGLSFNPGAWYINPTSGDFSDELDLYASLDWTSGAGTASLGYTSYSYPDAGGDTNEIGLGLGYDLECVSLGAAAYYDFDLELHYYEFSAGTSVDLVDGVAVSVGATLGLGEDDFTHALLVASLPIALGDNATLEPYIAYNHALDGTKGVNEDDETLFGGVSISVNF